MLASWKKSYDQPKQHIKSRDITLPTKVHLVKAMVFPVVMYGCESWTVKKAERWRIDAFELWCWRRLLRVPWTARRFNQSILKEISPEYSLEGLMLKLKLQCFGHLMWRTDSLEKTLMLEKIKGGKGYYILESFYQKMVKILKSENGSVSHSVVFNSSWPHGLLALQALPSLEFSRQEYWSR